VLKLGRTIREGVVVSLENIVELSVLTDGSRSVDISGMDSFKIHSR
jgi:hypothetical protein